MSGSVLGAIEIQMLMDLARLRQDMEASKGIVGAGMREIAGYVNFAKSALVGLTGIAGVSSFAGFVSGAIEARAKLYDLGLQTGITVEQLAALGKVAKYSDTSLAEIASASNKLSKALAASNEDSKGAAQGIEALGLNFDKFKALTPDQRLLEVAQAMGKFKDNTGQGVAAMLLFGKAGAELVPFLKELEERGLQATKMTTASALAAKQYEDNLISLKNAGDEWKKQLVNDILPTLVSVTDQLLAGRQAYGGWFKAITDIGWNVDPVKTLNQNAADSTAELVKLQEQLKRIRAEQESGSVNSKLFGGTLEQDARRVLNSIDLAERRLAYLRQQMVSSDQAGRGKVNPGDVDKPALVIEPPASGGTVPDTYTPFINAINSRLAVESAELDLGRKLTEAEKFRVEQLEKLRTGVVKATDAQQVYAQNELAELLFRERETKADEAELRFQEQSRRESEQFIDMQAQRQRALEDANGALARQAEEYGLTRDQLEALQVSRLRAEAVDVRGRRLVAEMNPMQQRLNEIYGKQADELDRLALARERLNERMTFDANDPTQGASRAIKNYLDEVKRAGDATEQAVGRSVGALEETLTSLFAKGKFDARSLVDTIISEMVRLRVVKPLLSEIFSGGTTSGTGNWLSQLFGGSSTAGYTGNTTGPVDGFAGAFAAGGYIPPGKWGMTGEEGPEPVFGGRTGVTVQSARSGGITLAPVTNVRIDARSDQAQVYGAVMQAQEESNRALLAELRAQGLLGKA